MTDTDKSTSRMIDDVYTTAVSACKYLRRGYDMTFDGIVISLEFSQMHFTVLSSKFSR